MVTVLALNLERKSNHFFHWVFVFQLHYNQYIFDMILMHTEMNKGLDLFKAFGLFNLKWSE